MTGMRSKLSRLLDVPTGDADVARRGKLLNIMLVGAAVIAALMLLVTVTADALGVAGEPGEVRMIYLGTLVLLLGIGLISIINHRRPGWFAASLFLALLTAVIVISDRPKEIAEGRSLFLFSLPIILASVLLPPYASFAVAALSGLVVAIVGLGVRIVPNPTVVSGFLIIALVSWLSARSLERALGRLRVANKALTAEKEFSEGMLNTLVDTVFVFDPQTGEPIRWNRAFNEISGFTDEEIASKKAPNDWYGDDDLEKAAVTTKQLLRGEQAAVEMSLITKSGKLVPSEYTASTMRDSEGIPQYIIALGRDVAERRRAEEMLRAQRDKLEGVIASLGDGVDIISRDYRVHYQNQVLVDRFGDLTGELCYRGYMAREAPCEPCPMVEAIATGSTQVAEMTGADGSEYELTSTPFQDIDGEIKVVEVVRDITERKRAEEALQAYSERLEEMVQERTQELRDAQGQLVRSERLAVLGQLAGGVGHELRNPLGAIKNAAYYLNMVLESPEAEVKEALGVLEKEADTSEGIVSGLLDFARAKPPIWQELDLNQVVGSALARTPVPAHVEATLDLEEGLPIIAGDRAQLEQVFGNIMLNAIQAMPEGGRLVVKTSEVSGEPPRSREVAVSISDTGVGIPHENLEKLFEPLFTTKARGIGLGLALAKMLVVGHGGSIEVESVVGEGTTFTVRLPVAGGGVGE